MKEVNVFVPYSRIFCGRTQKQLSLFERLNLSLDGTESIEVDGEEVPCVSTFQLFIISRGADGPPDLELQTRTSLINFNFTPEALTDYFLVSSVTRCRQILQLWHNFKSLGQNCEGLFRIWQSFNLTLAKM